MKSKNLRRVLRKVNILKLIVPSAVAVMAGAALFAFGPKNIKTVLIDGAAQTRELYSSGSHYVQYTADVLYYAGVDYRVNDKIKARVYYRLEDGRCYFFIISADKLPKNGDTAKNITLNARLLNNNSIYRRIIASLSESVDFDPQGLEEICSDILISQYDYAYGFSTYYSAALLLVCIISGVILFIRAAAVIFPSVSPQALYLGRYGSKNALFAAAGREFAAAAPPRAAGLYLTDNFLFHIAGGSADIVPLENITWVYTSNEIRHFKGRPQMNCTLCLLTESKRTHKIRHMSSKVAADIIAELQSKYPSIMAGE